MLCFIPFPLLPDFAHVTLISGEQPASIGHQRDRICDQLVGRRFVSQVNLVDQWTQMVVTDSHAQDGTLGSCIYLG